MEKHDNGITCGIVIAKLSSGKEITRRGGPGEAAVFGCFDKVEVEHIRNGQVIFTDEEK